MWTFVCKFYKYVLYNILVENTWVSFLLLINPWSVLIFYELAVYGSYIKGKVEGLCAGIRYLLHSWSKRHLAEVGYFLFLEQKLKKNQVFMVSFTVTILIILWSEIVKNRKGCSSWYVGFSFTHYVHKIFCTLNRKLQLSLSIVVPFEVTFQIFIFSFRTSAVS